MRSAATQRSISDAVRPGRAHQKFEGGVCVGVVPDRVALRDDPPSELGMPRHPLSDDKKGGTGTALAQEPQDFRRARRVWAVVDREPDLLPAGLKGRRRRPEGLLGGEYELQEDPGVGRKEHHEPRGQVMHRGKGDAAGLEREDDEYPGSHSGLGAKRPQSLGCIGHVIVPASVRPSRKLLVREAALRLVEPYDSRIRLWRHGRSNRGQYAGSGASAPRR